MNIQKDNTLIGIVGPILLITLLVIIGNSIAILPSLVPILFVIGLSMFLVSFTNTRFAMIILIYAMLLSPEISFGALSRQRDIVIRIEDLLIIAFFIAWLAQSAISGKAHIFAKTPINRAIGFYCFIFIVSTARGMITADVQILNGFFYILKYIEYFLLYYLATNIIKTKKQFKAYLKAFIITFAIVNIYACLQIGTFNRVSAPFEGQIGEPNTLGGYQVLLLGIILGLLTQIKTTRWRWPLVGLAVFSLVPFLFTLSRSSYLAIIPMYLSLIVLNKNKGRNVLIGVFLVIIIGGILFTPSVVKDRIAYTFIPQEQETIKPVEVFGVSLGPSASARLQDWALLLIAWKEHPFLGYGVTGKGFVDSQYIRTLVELGLIGFVAFIFLLVSIFRTTQRIYKKTNDDLFKGVALGFLAGHVGMIVHAMTANTYILIRVMEPYWFLAAMVMMIPKIESAEEKAQVTKTVQETRDIFVRRYPRNIGLLNNHRRYVSSMGDQ